LATAHDGTLQYSGRYARNDAHLEITMTWGKGILLWLIGIPLPIIILLALFWR
jgi:hypothetical protein